MGLLSKILKGVRFINNLYLKGYSRKGVNGIIKL